MRSGATKQQDLRTLSQRDLRALQHAVRAEEVRRRFEHDPEAAARKARQAVLKVQRRHERKRPKRSEAHDVRLARVRLLELAALFAHRWGAVLPEDDAGRDDAKFLAHHARTLPGDQRANISGHLARWAPWMAEPEVDGLVREAIDHPVRWRADNASALPTYPQDQKTTKVSVNLIALEAQQSDPHARVVGSIGLCPCGARRESGNEPQSWNQFLHGFLPVDCASRARDLRETSTGSAFCEIRIALY
jgi:hypothetical protein